MNSIINNFFCEHVYTYHSEMFRNDKLIAVEKQTWCVSLKILMILGKYLKKPSGLFGVCIFGSRIGGDTRPEQERRPTNEVCLRFYA